MPDVFSIILLCGGMMILLAAASFFSKNYSLDRIKSKTVGDGQHGTVRWATKKEIAQTYQHISFVPALWRAEQHLPATDQQGLVVGCNNNPTRYRNRRFRTGPWTLKPTVIRQERKSLRSRIPATSTAS